MRIAEIPNRRPIPRYRQIELLWLMRGKSPASFAACDHSCPACRLPRAASDSNTATAPEACARRPVGTRFA
jgi:hypothetical protein